MVSHRIAHDPIVGGLAHRDVLAFVEEVVMHGAKYVIDQTRRAVILEYVKVASNCQLACDIFVCAIVIQLFKEGLEQGDASDGRGVRGRMCVEGWT